MKVEITKNSFVRLTVLAAALLFSADAMAATQSVTANISFDTPLSLHLNSDIFFGTVAASSTPATYTISTAGAVTTSNGTWITGVPKAGSITIAGSTTQNIGISVGSYTADSGVTPANATCSYNGSASVACTSLAEAGPGAGKILLIGADVTTDGTQTANTSAKPTFTVTVTYQ